MADAADGLVRRAGGCRGQLSAETPSAFPLYPYRRCIKRGWGNSCGGGGGDGGGGGSSGTQSEVPNLSTLFGTPVLAAPLL